MIVLDHGLGGRTNINVPVVELVTANIIGHANVENFGAELGFQPPETLELIFADGIMTLAHGQRIAESLAGCIPDKVVTHR